MTKFVSYILLAFTLVSCTTAIKLKDVPIIKPIIVNEKTECVLKIHFVSGKAECIDEKVYREEILPTALILPYESYFFFRELALKACLLAEKGRRSECTHDVKSFDDYLEKVKTITEKYEELK